MRLNKNIKIISVKKKKKYFEQMFYLFILYFHDDIFTHFYLKYSFLLTDY